MQGVGVNAVEVTNRGIHISSKAEAKLKHMCWFIQHRINTGRTIDPADVTLDAVSAIEDLREWELSHETPPLPAAKDVFVVKSGTPDWGKTFENFEEILRNTLGVTGVPLSYGVRTTLAAKDDPDAAAADGGWPTKQDEMIGRAPMMAGADPLVLKACYLTDRKEIFRILAALCKDHDCWTYVKQALASRDGRMAYFLLKDHYLGPMLRATLPLLQKKSWRPCPILAKRRTGLWIKCVLL